jgi:hypothetical protein
MKNLKRFGFVLVCAMVLGIGSAFAAAAPVDPNAVNSPSWVINELVVDTSDEDFSQIMKDLSSVDLGFKADIKKYVVTSKALPVTTFASLQNAVDYAERAIERLNEYLADQVNLNKLDPKKNLVDAKTAARLVSCVSVIISVAPGTYEGVTISGMNVLIVGNYDTLTKKFIGFKAKDVAEADDTDYSYTEIGKGKAGSAVSATGGIVRLSNLVITGGKNNVGGGVYFDDVYGQVINCLIWGNSAAYGAAVAVNNGKQTYIANNFITNNKVLVKGKAGGSVFVMGGEQVMVANNIVVGNKAVNGLSAGVAVYRGKKNVVYNNIIMNNSAAPGYPNFQLIIGGAIKTEDDESSQQTGLRVDANILLGMVRTNKTKTAKNFQEYGIAEEIGENGFIDLYGHKLINNLFVKGTLNYVYRNSIGTRQFKNISIEAWDDINNPDNTGSQSISKRNKNELVLYRDGYTFPRKISGTDLRKKLYPKIDAKAK